MSSLPAVSTTATPTPSYQPLDQGQNGFRSDFRQLAQALGSGDLAGAQQAFASLQKLASQGTAASAAQGTSGTGAGNGRQAAFQALGQALQTGNLSAAQQAFSQLQQAGGRHHHHHGGQEGGTEVASASSAGGDTLNITNNSGTINEILGSGANASASGGETINITGNTGTINIIA